jgi:CBS domain-containing protein
MDELTRIKQAQTLSELLVVKQSCLRAIQADCIENDLSKFGQQMNMEMLAERISSIHDALCVRILELEWDCLCHSSSGTNRSVVGNRLNRIEDSVSWVRLGSAGRSEATLFPDQDHMCIYKQGELNGAGTDVRTYQRWMSRVVDDMKDVGYPYCKGFVMSTNPRWNGTWNDFKERIEAYISYPTWEHVRYVMMLVDMRSIYGNSEWVTSLRTECIERSKDVAYVLWKVIDGGWTRSDGLSFLGNIRLVDDGPYRGLFPIKERIYFPLVNSIRLWSVANGIDATSSWNRSKQLHERGIWDTKLYHDVVEALNLYYKLRILRQIELQSKSAALDDEDLYIDLHTIGKDCVQQIRQALETVYVLHKRSASQFRKPR